jgi:hypothetical protein
MFADDYPRLSMDQASEITLGSISERRKLYTGWFIVISIETRKLIISLREGPQAGTYNPKVLE